MTGIAVIEARLDQLHRFHGDRWWRDDWREEGADWQTDELIAEVRTMIGWLRALEPHLDAVICYASTMGEHPPNQAVAEIRNALRAATPMTPS